MPDKHSKIGPGASRLDIDRVVPYMQKHRFVVEVFHGCASVKKIAVLAVNSMMALAGAYNEWGLVEWVVDPSYSIHIYLER